MLRDGELDVSPSSSIEYLRNKNLYDIIDGHSISSIGAVGSVFLFSKKPIEQLGGKAIAITSQTDTSIALLKIILHKFYGIGCDFTVHQNPMQSGSDAFLLIGDDAMRYKAIANGLFSYDLGEIWHKNTMLPFVFALWIVRKNIRQEKRILLKKFIEDLDYAKSESLKNFQKIVSASPLRAFISENEILSYWQKIDYNFADEHKKGLELFDRYIQELEI
jgi:chorismate dehydratase